MREAVRGELDELDQNSLNKCTDSLPGKIEKTHQLKRHRGLVARHKSVFNKTVSSKAGGYWAHLVGLCEPKVKRAGVPQFLT